MARNSLWYLQNLPFFASLQQDALVKLDSRVRLIRHPARAKVPFYDASQSAFLVVEGAAKLVRRGLLGRRIVETLLVPSNLFGTLTLSAPANPFVLETTSAITLLSIPVDLLLKLVETHPGFAITVIQSLEDRQRELRRSVENLLLKDVSTRVAQTLQWLACEHGDKCQHGWAMDVRITQQDLADLCGASRQAVSGVLRKLELRLIIRRKGRVICILSMKRLAGYAPVDAVDSV